MKEMHQQCEDLIRRYDILTSISHIVATSRDLNKILRVTLKGVTFGDGFGFNRAMLFLLDEHRNMLKAKMAIGTETAEEAWKIWQEIDQKNYTLEKFLSIERVQEEEGSSLNKKIEDLQVPIEQGKVIEAAFRDASPKNIDLEKEDAEGGYVTDRAMIEEKILSLVDFPRFCIIPLVSRTKKVGIMIVDNKYNDRQITKEDSVFLMMLGQFAASSIRNTMIYNELKEKINYLANLHYQIKLLKEYHENIIESIHLNIFVVDNGFKITACNQNFADLMGLEKSRIIGQNIRDYKVAVGEADLVSEILDVMQQGQVKRFRHVRVQMEGHENDSLYNVTLTALRDPHDKKYGVIVIINDVTRTASLERSLAEARRFSELGKLSASIAHEIRNPLIAIGGYANRIKRKFLEDASFDPGNIDVIVSEISRLERILNDILDYGSQKKTPYEPLRLDSLLLDCVGLAEVAAEQKNIDIRAVPALQGLQSGDWTLYGSYNNLKQAFINVLNNAIEASTKGQTITLCLDVIDLYHQRIAVIQINNPAVMPNGKDINDIFAPFYTTKSHGTGLGLSITKKIVEEHLGSILVESSPEKGTTFMIHLPLSPHQVNISGT